MSIILIVILVVLVFGAALTVLLANTRSRYSRHIAPLILTVCTILWTVGYPLIQDSATFSINTSDIQLLWSLQIDGAVWKLGFTLLLFVTGATISLVASRKSKAEEESHEEPNRYLPATILLLALASLTSLWLLPSPGLLIAWMFLGVVWLAFLAAASEGQISLDVLLRQSIGIMVSLAFLWLGTASLMTSSVGASVPVSSIQSPRLWLTLAAITQLGVYPFLWRKINRFSLPPSLAGLALIAPAIPGALLLVRIASGNVWNDIMLLLLSLIGILGMFYGAFTMWTRSQTLAALAANASVAFSALLLLAAVWSGARAGINQTIVLVLAAGSLFVLVQSGSRPTRWQKILVLPAIMAAAGFPLTAGSVALSNLYNDLLSREGAVIFAVIVLLIFSNSVILIATWRGIKSRRLDGSDLDAWTLSHAPLAMFALGLFAVPELSITRNSLISWLAIILALTVAIAVANLSRTIHNISEALRRAFGVGYSLEPVELIAGKILRFAAGITRQAALILEGEGGMLWLILFVVIFWLARRV